LSRPAKIEAGSGKIENRKKEEDARRFQLILTSNFRHPALNMAGLKILMREDREKKREIKDN
jgi:hypothetical protein